jgi:outer membrane protein assembly complex protein YaeT
MTRLLVNKYIFSLFILFFSLYIGANSFFVDCMKPDYEQQVNTYIPASQKLLELVFIADFSIDEQELLMITGLKKGELVSAQEILVAIFYLEQKVRFAEINLEINQVNEGIKIIFHLAGQMIFSRLHVHGYLTSKFKYKNAYVLNEGDFFDLSKHQHSLKNIEKIFREEGYFKGVIKDTIFYDDKKKSVIVDLSLEKKSCCKVEEVILHLHGEAFDADELLQIKKKIEHFCLAKLKNKYCSQKLIEKHKEHLEKFLSRRGLLYSQIQVKTDVSELIRVIVTIELNRKKEIVFLGNHYFSKEDFIEKMLLYGKSAWHFPASIISDELKQMYHEKGFWAVEITTNEEDGKVFCIINEGRRVRIVGVEYQGTKAFSQERLTTEILKGQLINKLFDKKKYDTQKQKIIDFYKNNGYWDVAIEQDHFHLLHDNPEQCIISLQVNEGAQKLLKSITVLGYPEIEKELSAIFVENSAIPFNYSLLVDQKNAIQTALKNKGYKNINVSYQLHEAENGTTLAWIVTLEKDVSKFGRAILVGDSLIAYHKLLREFTFNPGEVWDRKKLDAATDRLRGLGVFDSVHIYPGQILDQNNERPILIKLVDADKYEARLRVGFQQIGKNLWFKRGFGYKVGGSFFVNNPFKAGDKIAINADATPYYGEYSMQYLYPWLFGLPIRSEVKAYSNQYRQPLYAGGSSSLYRATQQGFLLGMTRNFEKHTLGLASGIELTGIHDKNTDVKNVAQVIDYAQDLLNKKNTFIYLEPSFLYHNLDTILNPTAGFKSTVSCKGMIDFASKASFFKFLLEQSWYKQIIPRAVLAVRARAGHVFNQSFTNLVPIERFYLGGVNSIRGYYRDYCPPLGSLDEPIQDNHAGLPKQAEGLWKYAPQGGRTMIAFNAELRLNMYQSFDVAFFTDMGVLFKDSLDKPEENFAGGSGFGLRYNTPIGPLRFDIAWKWKIKYQDFEPAYIWYLTFGQAF